MRPRSLKTRLLLAVAALVIGSGLVIAFLVTQQYSAALRRAMPTVVLASTAESGLDPDHVEAMGFAWLARQTLHGRPGNLATVTGAAGPRILGAIYPA